MKLRNFVSASTLLILSTSTNAAIVSYDESISGDLSNNGNNPTHIGILDIGRNSVDGNISFPLSGFGDWDQFSFTVASDQQVSSINYNFVGNITIGFHIEQLMPDDTYTSFSYFNTFDPAFLDPANNLNILELTGVGTLSSGDYSIITTSYGVNDSGTNVGNTDYSWGINVSPVPVPSAVWLLCSGLIGFAGFAKSKKG